MAESPSAVDERLERARAIWDSRPLHQQFDIRLEEIRDGYVRFRMHANTQNRGGVHGASHGGILALIADVAALAAIGTVLDSNESTAGTAELNISYLSPATGSVVVEATVLRKGRSLAVADVDLKDGSGKLLAKSRVSYAVRPAARDRMAELSAQ
jgi:uncharacterized protein (TIGR00369 family)